MKTYLDLRRASLRRLRSLCLFILAFLFFNVLLICQTALRNISDRDVCTSWAVWWIFCTRWVLLLLLLLPGMVTLERDVFKKEVFHDGRSIPCCEDQIIDASVVMACCFGMVGRPIKRLFPQRRPMAGALSAANARFRPNTKFGDPMGFKSRLRIKGTCRNMIKQHV